MPITSGALSTSRWAQPQTHSPRSTPINHTNTATPTPLLLTDADRATRLLRRLYWKAESLLCSHARAVSILEDALSSPHRFMLGTNNFTDPSRNVEYEARRRHAESMFKVDFYEFYALLERFIGLCLGVFGISVTGGRGGAGDAVYKAPVFERTRSETRGGTPRSAPVVSLSESRHANGGAAAMKREMDGGEGSGTWTSDHAFHANLLRALDQEANPFHATLGAQDVRIQLGLAKDYRNWWKGADDFSHSAPLEGDSAQSCSYANGLGSRRRKKDLRDIGLDNMLHVVLRGLEGAHDVVLDRMREGKGSGHRREDVSHESMEVDGDGPYEFTDDAMELD